MSDRPARLASAEPLPVIVRQTRRFLLRALNGDSEAFGLLVRIYREEIYAIVLSMAGNPTDAEDLTQEVFIKAYLNLSQLSTTTMVHLIQ